MEVKKMAEVLGTVSLTALALLAGYVKK